MPNRVVLGCIANLGQWESTAASSAVGERSDW